MKKLITIMIIMLFCITGAFAYDTVKTVEIGDKSLPENGTFEISFTLQENESLYFNLTNKSNELKLNFPAEHLLNGSNQYNFTINWSIDETIFTDDKKLFAEILVTNSLNLNNHSIGLEFNIKKEGDRLLQINGSSSLVLRDGMYVKDVTVDKLPDNGTLNFFISGNPGEQFTLTSCGKFFICNNETFKLNENGGYELKLDYKIPLASPLGTFNESFNISSPTRNSSIKVQFNILIPNILLKPLELGPECFEPNVALNVQLECENKFRTYQVEVVRALQNYLSSVNTELICEKMIKTNYVIGDVVEDIVLNNYLEVQNDNKNLREDNTYLNKQLSTCQDEKSQLKIKINETILNKNQEIVSLKDSESQKRVDLFKATEIDKQKEKADTLFIMKIFCFIVFVLCIALIGAKFVFENVFMTDIKINVWIVGAIATFFFFCWLGLFVWG